MPLTITSVRSLSMAERLRLATYLGQHGYHQIADLMSAEALQAPMPPSFEAFCLEAQAILDRDHDGLPLRSLNLESIAYWYAKGETPAQVIARGLGDPAQKETVR